RDGIPRPVRALGVDKDDSRLSVKIVGVAPNVEVTLEGSRRRRPRPLKPRMLVGRVVQDQLDDDSQAAIMRSLKEVLEIIECPVTRMYVEVIGNVVPIVFQRRREERQQPEARHTKLLKVVELLVKALKIADAVGVGIIEGLDGQFVDNGVLVPEGIACDRCSSHEYVFRSDLDDHAT